MQNKDYPSLRECPFCGGEAFIRFLMGKAHIQPIHTKKCIVKPDTWLISDLPINKQIDAWNTRTHDERNKVYCKRYKKNHPDKIKEYKRQYNEKNRDKITDIAKRHYEKHSIEIKERSKNYYHTKIKNNPEAMAKRREYCRKWRENRRANDGT